MKNKRNNILYIFIGFLLLIIVILFIILFLPEDNILYDLYSVQDYIDVETTLKEGNHKNNLNLSQIQ